MVSWLIAAGFWFVVPQLAGALLAWPARRIARRNPNTLLPEIVAALAAAVTLLAVHGYAGAAIDRADVAVGYPNAWSVSYVLPAMIGHFIAAIMLSALAAPSAPTARTLDDSERPPGGMSESRA